MCNIFNTEIRVRQNLKRIQPYQPGLSDEQLRKQFGERRLVKLNSNENTLGPSPLAVDAIQRELSKLNLYPDGGSDLVRQAVATHHGIEPSHVFVGNGSDDIIKLISETFLDDGDEIVVPDPSFSQYSFGAHVMKARVKPVPLNDDFSYDVETFVNAVTPSTKLLYLCTPNNPTGTPLLKRQFYDMMERLHPDVFVVVDLAYDNYATDARRFQVTEQDLRLPNVCYLHTFSKLYGLAGLRVGYALGNPSVFSFMHRVREPFNVNRLAQVGACAALLDTEHVKVSQELAAQSRIQYNTLQDDGFHVVPSEANFALIEVGHGMAMFEMLRERGILVRAGYPGLDAYVRVTFGTKEENDLCIQAMREIGYLR